MSIGLRKLHHVQITVPAEKEALCRHFYGVLLGLEEFAKPAALEKNGGAWYRINDFELHVSLEDGVGDNGVSRRHLCYFVEDLKTAETWLASNGVEIVADKQPVDGWVRFYVRDPGNNYIEIAQEI